MTFNEFVEAWIKGYNQTIREFNFKVAVICSWIGLFTLGLCLGIWLVRGGYA